MRSRVFYRFAVPALVVGVAVSAAAVTPSLSSAQTPLLEPMSPTQLIAAMAGAKSVTYVGTLQATSNVFGQAASLLSSVGSSATVPDGSATAQVYRGIGQNLRVQVLNAQSERDLYVSAKTAWLWNSSKNQAVELTGLRTPSTLSWPTLNPTEIADSIVARASTSSSLSIGSSTYVGGQAVYDLVVRPTQTGSTVASVNIFVDAQNYHVLGVTVTAKDHSSPVLSVEFQKISFTAPSASLFQFTPPVGASVTTRSVLTPPSWMGVSATGAKTIGQGWEQVAVLPAQAATSSTKSATASSSNAFGQTLAELEQPVTIDGVSGKLVTTSLVNALILPSGQVLVGAVSPAVLAADASLVG
ncbi:MAG: LolA family protein [Ferrimicrobium sp.]